MQRRSLTEGLGEKKKLRRGNGSIQHQRSAESQLGCDRRKGGGEGKKVVGGPDCQKVILIHPSYSATGTPLEEGKKGRSKDEERKLKRCIKKTQSRDARGGCLKREKTQKVRKEV